jgi:hypothetical protein
MRAKSEQTEFKSFHFANQCLVKYEVELELLTISYCALS